jgi:hypothetical protein
VNEVRDIVARMMEEPAPPLRSPDEMLRIARRTNRRRSMLAAATSATLVLVLVVGVGVAVRLLPHRAPTDPPSVTDIAEPLRRAAPAHGEVMAQRIVAALPDGLAAVASATFHEGSAGHDGSAGEDTGRVPAVVDDSGRILAAAVVLVSDGHGRGEVFAYLVADGSSGDETSVACDDVASEPSDGCRLTWVNEIPLQVVTSTETGHPLLRIEVTRFLPGGRLVVGAWQGVVVPQAWTYDDAHAQSWLLQPLAEPVDIQILTALAADPAMLP